MHLLQTGDLFIPSHEWHELMRIVAVEGYPQDELEPAAAMEALARIQPGDLLYAVRTPEKTLDGVILRRSE